MRASNQPKPKPVTKNTVGDAASHRARSATASTLGMITRAATRHICAWRLAAGARGANVPGNCSAGSGTRHLTTSSEATPRWQQWLRRAAGFYGDESTAIRHSHALFGSCYGHATQPQFRTHLMLEDDFFHNHALINLHVWMAHHRLRSAPGGKQLQEQMYDRFWENTTKRIRALGVPELTVNKHLRETQTFSFGAATVYDYGLAEDEQELAGALYRNVFCNNQDVPEALVMETTAYVQRQVEHLAQLSNENVLAGELTWLPALGCAGGEGASASSDDADQWKEAKDDRGRVYLYHVKTKETKWVD